MRPEPDTTAGAHAISIARSKVIALLVLLFAITYLDRVCISVAGPRIQDELSIAPIGWGWVTGMFTFAYCAFELPAGLMGDRLGPRRTLTRIVLWWSAFTAMTGAVVAYPQLLVTRFLFGVGEAGAFPGANIVVARWFPASRRATVSGVILMSSQMGGALAPLLVVPIQARWGWRTSFYVFSVLGVLWALLWYGWFRDAPSEKIDGRPSAPALQPITTHRQQFFGVRSLLHSPSVLALLAIGFSYIYVGNFYQSWLHTYLVRGRGFSEGALWLSSVPFAVGAGANLLGGLCSDELVRRQGQRSGRRAIGVVALLIAAGSILSASVASRPLVVIALLSIAYGAISFQQSAAFGACLDLAHRQAGAMLGLFNTTAQLGGLAGSVLYGYLVEASGNYNTPFYPMSAVLLLGSLLWWKVDAEREVQVPADGN